MLNLTFAPSADILAELAKDRILGAWRDPFNPPAVVVPNPAVGKWLSVRLAEDPSVGCIANARMLTLERFLWNALGPDQDTVLIDVGHLSQVVCALLDECVLGDDVYKPIRDYLYNDLSIDPIKRVQLSARIAGQFLEYEYNRPSVWDEAASDWRRLGIDAKWLKNAYYFDGREHEAWQMDLYRRVYECLSKNTSPCYTTLPHLYRYKRKKCAKERRPWCDIGSNHQIILFGVSKISHFHRNTLVEISQCAGIDMHVFLTNPCAEFWEDVDTSRRTRAPRRRWSNDSPDEAAGIKPVKPEDYDKEKLDLFNDEEDHALLKLWGAAGKENIFLWCPQAQWNFEYHVSSDDCDVVNDIGIDNDNTGINTTLLKAIQRSLLSRNNNLGFINTSTPLTSTISTSSIIPTQKDDSLLILACPDLSREVEEVRELILDMAHDDVIDCFDDIAVYIPDPNKYAPYIQRVFGAYPHGHQEYIPFTILGASGGSSLVARALSALLGIAAGGFNRAMIFELLDNPIVMTSRGFSHGDLERWEEWVEAYGMFRGYNAEQRGLMGDRGSAVIDEHTFEHGMRRVLMKNDDERDERETRSAEIFMSLLKELNELSTFFSGGDGTLDIREAAETVRRAVWAWIGRIGNGSADEAAETRVRREILNRVTQIELQHTCAGRTEISNEEFLALARDCVAAELSAAPTAWRGVTFAPLRASMVLPHRVIFAMGLGAAEFPGTNETPGWDLLSSKRIVGDSDRVRDNRFAFLEMMHAAKERLILSYRARDMQKDEGLQPSSVVLELEEYLIGQGAVDSEVNSRKCSARREVPWVVHETLSAAREAGRGHGSWDKEQRMLATDSLMERVKHRHDLNVDTRLPTDGGQSGNKDTPVNTENKGSSTMPVDLRDLKKFLANPLEYHLGKTLGIRNDEDTGDMAATDEPLDSGNKIYALRKNVWIAILNNIFSNGASVEDAAVDIYKEHVDSGQAPEGYVRDMEREELVEWAKAAYNEAMSVLSVEFSNHRLVDAEKDKFSFSCDDFKFNDASIRLAVVPKEPDDNAGKIGIFAFDKAGKPADNLNLWLDGTAMWLNEMGNGGKRRQIALVTLNHGDKPKVQISYMRMDEQKLPEVNGWLACVLTQMLIKKRNEHLPFSVIAGILKPEKNVTESFGTRLDRLTARSLKDYFAKKGYATYTEAFDLTDAKPFEADDGELRQIAKSRYAPILGRWIHE